VYVLTGIYNYRPDCGGQAEATGCRVPQAPVLPDVPTLEEQGFPDFVTSLWFGLLAPAQTPRPIIEKLADVVPKALQRSKAQDALRKQAFETLNSGLAQFADCIRQETEHRTAAAHAAGLRI
jgi:tripartite-type tricarboxylate transporter receptor subunit TctC